MFSACLLFVLFNIVEMVSATRNCPVSVGSYRKRDTVLDPLAKLIEEKVKGASYACALEPRAYLRFVQLTEQQWQKVYGKVKNTMELEYETEKPEKYLRQPEELAKEAVQKWSSDLAGAKGGRFACIIDQRKQPTKTAYKVACLFE
ncbi:hypothetical protein ANCCAN_03218 [Ancylostoma caninum]|uniref:SCP domain-containing protein n=1 Tax=Ancylostoma caninum TaxID=29170 RepID=A0A368H5Q5_ANCCA|nr:hypothetical protein ANCCAN_03218 [Ancylostoma caninum]